MDLSQNLTPVKHHHFNKNKSTQPYKQYNISHLKYNTAGPCNTTKELLKKIIIQKLQRQPRAYPCMGRFSRDRRVGLLVRVEVEAVCVVEVEEELMADAEAEVEAA